MRHLATLAAIVLLVAPVGAAAAQSTSGPAKLRLLSLAPLKVKGTGFKSRERVVVRLMSRSSITRRRITAGRTGAWVLGFSRLDADRCDVLVVSAVGSRGSRAALKLPAFICPPPIAR
ncbi:MAG TPA: hypothetical protein VFO03_10310 [Gaiellaceae bacterium]|nr:hypothetical protein [Gaiellaceae bacterium]